MVQGTDAGGRSTLPRWLWLLWAAFIVYGTSIPFEFTSDHAFVVAKFRHLTFNPFVAGDTGRRVSIPDTVQNILLFVPFGVLGVVALGRIRAIWIRLPVVTLLGTALSTSVEILQLFTRDRVSSFSDVASDTLGALAGGIAAVALGGVFRRSVGQLRRLGLVGVPAFYPMAVAALLACVAGWEPFDVTLEIGSVWVKVKAFVHDPVQGGVPTDEVLQILRYALLSLLTATWFRQLGWERPVRRAMLVGAFVGVSVEASQILIGSRMPGLEDAAVNVAGSIVGGCLYGLIARFPWPRAWFGALVVVSWLGAMVQNLSPFIVAPVRRGFIWIPFISYYDRTSFLTLSHTLELMMIYFPLGFALPWVFPRWRQVYVVAIVCAVVMEFPIEYLQGWMVERYPDVTDVLVAALGSVAGAWVGWDGWSRFLAHADPPLRGLAGRVAPDAT